MPIVYHRHIRPIGEVGIWEIREREEDLRHELNLRSAEEEQIAGMIGKRRIEWLAGRQLLHQMSGREMRGVCLKDEFGKPHLADSDYHISISHSHDMVAVAAAPRSVGVDVQFLVPKIERIAYKFMRPEESESLADETRMEHLHVFWGAKEALYKAYGRRQLDFREHLHIEPFLYRPEGGRTTGWVQKNDYRAYFQIVYDRWEDYILVYAVDLS